MHGRGLPEAGRLPEDLAVSVGQFSDRGRKATNQDFHGVLVPGPPLLGTKGIAAAIADGISSSPVAHVASESAVKGFLEDYYATSEAWSVKTSAQRVIAATNSWLHAQTRQAGGDPDRGHVCTFSALVLKSATAHLFHVGDARIWRLAGDSLEQLTEDHRVVASPRRSYLGRALGARHEVDLDYQALPVAAGEVFVLTTDGVHEHLSPRRIAAAIRGEGEGTAADLDRAARRIAEEAHANGSPDNLTVQILRVDRVPAGDAAEAAARAAALPPPPPSPLLRPGTLFDGYRILRPIHASSRSHIYLAEDAADGGLAALKLPSVDLRGDAAYLRRLAMEEWIARRVDSPHVLRAHGDGARRRAFLYAATEYVEGQTLAQWMTDNPRPELERVRDIVEQVARGLRALHRREILHQDLRPENILIDRAGTARIMDFGSARVAGLAEASAEEAEILGTAQHAAPEYFLGEGGSERSDLFSLGVIAYRMVTGGRLPYGTAVAQARTPAQQRALRYRPARDDGARHDIPAWVDGALEKALRVDPAERYAELSEFVHDLRHPNPEFAARRPRPLLERDPVMAWKLVSLALALTVAALLVRIAGPG